MYYNENCVKSAQIRSFSGPHFPAFGMNTEIYRVNLRILSECGKRRTEKLRTRTLFKQWNTSNFPISVISSYQGKFEIRYLNIWGIFYGHSFVKRFSENTTCKVSVFGVMLVRIFPHSD